MKQRSGITIYITMETPKYGVSEKVLIDIPWNVIFDTLEEYFENMFYITGRGKHIWNMLCDLEAISGNDRLIDKLLEEEDINNLIIENYKQSSAYEEDYENWFEDIEDQYNWEHKLGIYAEEQEDEQ